ncbi:MAG TPA: hypothetical protein VIS74_04790 [Chthoniobacterales bacterium]
MKIPTLVAVPIIAFAVLIPLGIGYLQFRGQNTQAEPPAVVNVSLPYQTEEGWTVTQVAQFLSDYGALANGKKMRPLSAQPASGADASETYQIQWDGKTTAISLAAGVWNPAS